ncbi:MAG: hypothetical protein HWD60_04880 [Defluviicoccus sp.]|nr:MAG: hypothetical protein HWD60_04880 [Defluviicoccus sp.]
MLRYAIATCALVLAAAPASATSYCHGGSLRILLTNDDGYQAPGIRALQTALGDAGFAVTMVAPATNQSGSGAALSLSLIDVSNPESGVYAVAGTPATTVLLGVSAIFPANQKPNLIVSGINTGANVGAATPISGTVGVTIAAITQFAKPIPAIAVSTDLVEGTDPTTSANLQHFADVAAFTSRLVDQLVSKSCASGAGLLPRHTAINVNYPPLAPTSTAGIKMAVQGRTPSFLIGYVNAGNGQYAPTYGAAPASPDVPQSDTVAFSQGFVTIVPIDGDYTAGPRADSDQSGS